VAYEHYGMLAVVAFSRLDCYRLAAEIHIINTTTAAACCAVVRLVLVI